MDALVKPAHVRRGVWDASAITSSGGKARPVVPMHRGDLPTGTLRTIIKQAGLSVREFLDLL